MHSEIKLSKQPPSLRVFFATEMWERYGFYVVQSLLALYLALHFKWIDQRIYSLVGSFTALTYLSPIVGGWIADQLLGQKRTILIGAVFLLLSYLSLTLFNSESLLPAALAGIAVGTGLLKPNISSLLGNEYPTGSSRRERGFTIFYMGITVGIILGTTLPSILSNQFGWPISFLSAAFGMIIAIAVFVFGVYHYKIKDYYPSEFQISEFLKALGLMLVLWTFSFYILNYPFFASSAFSAVVLLSAIYMTHSIKNESPNIALLNLVIAFLCIISVVFWAFYFQMFMSLTLFISRVVESKLWDINFPPPYYVSIQSLGMILFGFLLTRNRQRLSIRETGKRTAKKFMISMFFMCLAYLSITLICKKSLLSPDLLSPLYFIPVYLMISVAELLLSPVGLSAITVLASRKKVSTMMGIFFVSLGTGGFLSGKLANLTAVKSNALSIIELKTHYAQVFSTLLYILLAATVVCSILSFWIHRWLSEHHEEV